MSSLADGWRADLDAVDARLIDEFQSGFPIHERPFQVVGEELGVGEDDALARVERLREQGIFRRFGAVLNPPVIGSSTLAAVQAPEERFAEIADIVNSHRQVNHNYRRDHNWNMWFVVTAGSRETRDAILADIEHRTGCDVLNLPMLTDFYINLEFPVVNADRFARESSNEATAVRATRISESATGDLTALEARLLLAIQDGLPLTLTPYRDVAAELGAPVERVLGAVCRLLDVGCIKRIGCVVNHVATGFDANCMVVWDVPDGELDARGTAVGALPSVTLCYHRPRRPEQGWPYTLFTMIHGRDAPTVDEKIDDLADEHLPYAHERLYSTETLKQTGARYDELVGEE
jgi:DNA-binding Lrp family transcriptional regulator